MIEVKRWLANQINYAMFQARIKMPSPVFVTNERDFLKEAALPICTIRPTTITDNLSRYGGFTERMVVTIWLPEGEDPDKSDDIIRALEEHVSAQRGETENYFFVVSKSSLYDEVFHSDLKAWGIRTELTIRGLKKP